MMKNNYSFIFLVLIILLSGCANDDLPELGMKPIAQFTFSEFIETGSSNRKLEIQFNTSFEEEQLKEIDMELRNAICISISDDESTCDVHSIQEFNRFLYQNESLDGYEFETTWNAPDISAHFENGRLQSVMEKIDDQEFATTYSYEDDKVVKIEHKWVDNPVPIWVKDLEYEGNNMTRMHFDLILFQNKQEWIVTYDDSINPFYKNHAWIMAMKMGMNNWRDTQTISREALVFSENNVSSLTINFEIPENQISEVFTFERTYDSSNRPIATNISSSRSRSQWQQLYSYIE